MNMRYDLTLIGQAFRAERSKRSFKIEKAAEIFDFSASYMGLLERGKRGVSVKFLFTALNYYDMSLDDFLTSGRQYKEELLSSSLNEPLTEYDPITAYNELLDEIETISDNEAIQLLQLLKRLREE